MGPEDDTGADATPDDGLAERVHEAGAFIETGDLDAALLILEGVLAEVPGFGDAEELRDAIVEGRRNGILALDLESGHRSLLTETGDQPQALSDGRRVLFLEGNRILLLNVETRTSTEVLSVEEPDTIGSLALSHDERTLFYSHRGTEADIWLLNAK